MSRNTEKTNVALFIVSMLFINNLTTSSTQMSLSLMKRTNQTERRKPRKAEKEHCNLKNGPFFQGSVLFDGLSGLCAAL